MPDTAAHDAIRATIATWFRAMESGDVALALSVVTDDVVQQSPSGTPRVGRAALREALAAFHAAYTESVEFTLADVEIAGERAAARVRETAVVRSRGGGSALRASGTHQTTLVRQPDGSWRIARDVSALDGPPTPLETAPDRPA